MNKKPLLSLVLAITLLGSFLEVSIRGASAFDPCCPIPPPPPWSHSAPIIPLDHNFLSAEQLQDREGDIYILTMLNGTSASFEVKWNLTKLCLERDCKPSHFPKRLNVLLSLPRLDNLSTSYMGTEKHRQISRIEYDPKESSFGSHGPVYQQDGISVEMSASPIVLTPADPQETITVTLTVRPNVTYGLYALRMAIEDPSYGNVGEGRPLLFLKTVNFKLGLWTKYFNIMGLMKDYPAEQRSKILGQYPNIRSSERFSNSSWFALEPNATLKASYDGASYQYGIWEIRQDGIFFFLADATFNGTKGMNYQIVLYDNSVWAWSGLTGGPPKSDVLPAHPPGRPPPAFMFGSWRPSLPFSPMGFCSIEKGWVGHYANATTYSLRRGTSASLKFTISSMSDISALNLSLNAGVFENERTVQSFPIEEIEGVSIVFTPSMVSLKSQKPTNVTATLGADNDASEKLYGMQFVRGQRISIPMGGLIYEGEQNPSDEGYRPPYGEAGQKVLFFLKITDRCPETELEVLKQANPETLMQVAIVLATASAIIASLFVLVKRKRLRPT